MPQRQKCAVLRRSGLLLPLLVFVASASGCSDVDESPPVPESKTISLLADLHIAGARDLTVKDEWGVRDSILQVHGLDTTAYRELLDWYGERPERYVRLYGNVLDHLSSMWDSRGRPAPANPDTLVLP